MTVGLSVSVSIMGEARISLLWCSHRCGAIWRFGLSNELRRIPGMQRCADKHLPERELKHFGGLD